MSSRRELPVFIQGCHRSGTTLLRALLDVHPELACPPESKFIAGLHAFATYPQVEYALNTIGVSEQRLRGICGGIVTDIMETYARTHGKRRWIDKTPNYYRLVDFIDDLFDREVLFVILTRHPLDVVESLHESPYFRPETANDPDLLSAIRRYGHTRQGWGAYWVEVYSALLGFAAAWPSRALVVRYEDLVTSTVEVLDSVLRFIGEDPIARQLVDLAFDRPLQPGWGDWKIGGTNAVHDRSVGRWRSGEDADLETAVTTWRVVCGLAGTVGYDGPAGA